jgi:hypothetical protein
MKIHAIVNQFPSGRWGFVGFKVPGELSFIATPEELKKAHAAGCAQFLKRRVFDTQIDAQTALDAWCAANPEYSA